MMYAKSSDFLTPFPDPPCHMQKSADFVPFVCFLGSKKKPVEKIVLPSPNEGLLGGFHLWGPQKFRIFLSPHTHTLSLLKISWFCSFCLLFGQQKKTCGKNCPPKSEWRLIRGLPSVRSTKVSDFFIPPHTHFVTVKNQLILFLLSAFLWPPPPWVRTSYMEAPLRQVQNSLLLFMTDRDLWRKGCRELFCHNRLRVPSIYNAKKHASCERRHGLRLQTLQCPCSGWPTGSGKKLSSSQAQLSQATCLDVA